VPAAGGRGREKGEITRTGAEEKREKKEEEERGDVSGSAKAQREAAVAAKGEDGEEAPESEDVHFENRSSSNKVGSGGVCDDAMRCAGGSAWLQERSLSSNGNGEAQQANNLEGKARLEVWQGKARRGKARSRVPSCSGSPETGTLKSRPGGWW